MVHLFLANIWDGWLISSYSWDGLLPPASFELSTQVLHWYHAHIFARIYS